MKKGFGLILSICFCLALCVCFGSTTQAYADVSGEAHITSHLRAGDGSVGDWSGDLPYPAVNATNIELAGLSIYTPAGYYVYSVELNGENITRYATASATSAELVFPAITFGLYDYSPAPVHIVPGEVNIDITYAPIDADTVHTVTYTSGVCELPEILKDENVFRLDNGAHVIKGYGQQFASDTIRGWLYSGMRLIYPNGSSVEVYSGQYITPYENCTVQIIYVLPLYVNVLPNLTAAYGDALPQGSDAYSFTNYSGADLSDISVDATVNYSSSEIGYHSVTLSDISVKKGDKTFTSAELQLYTFDGAISISQTPLTVRAVSAEKVYDGTALTGEEFTAEGLKDGDRIEYIVNDSSITQVGSVDSVITGVCIMNGDTDVTANYSITYESAVLTVTPADLKITAKDCTAVYNGYPQTASEFNIVGKLGEGDTLDVETVGTAKYVSDGKVIVYPSSAAVYNENGEDVSFCYNIDLDTKTAGSISIVRRGINVYSNNAEFMYNGSEFSAEEVGAYISEDTPLAETDELAGVVSIGKLTYIGETVITISDAKIICDGRDVTENYAVTYNPGRLSIIPDEEKGTITINLGDSKTYDGTELRNAYTWSGDEHALSGVSQVSVSGSSIGPNACSKQLSADNVSVTLYSYEESVLDNGDYNLVINSGTAEILKQGLKINPVDAAKEYDGKAYIGKIEREGSLAGGAKVRVIANTVPYLGETPVDGKAVGNYRLEVDKASVKIYNANGDNISENFDISYGEAKLKVTSEISTANYSKDAGGTVTISCGISPAEFIGASIDEVMLTPGKQYASSNGDNTMITIVNAALKDLSVGNHKLTLYYENAGEVSTTISVSQSGRTSSSAFKK